MKKTVIVLLALLAAPIPATAGGMISISADKVSIYTAPIMMGGKLLVKAYKGESYLAINETSDWYKVRLEDGSIGWINKSQVVKSEDKVPADMGASVEQLNRERARLDEERRLFEEQKSLIEDMKRLDDEKKGFGSSKNAGNLIVDATGAGDFRTIGEAVAAAASGAKITVKAGLYKEGLIIEKDGITVEGEPGAEVVSSDACTLYFNASTGTVKNLKLMYDGRVSYPCVDIAGGRLLLEDCELAGSTHRGLVIREGAFPIVRRNKIHDARQDGVYVGDNARGTIEENDIYANGMAGIEITSGADPLVRRNAIHDGKGTGIYVYDHGKGLIKDNDIYGNAFAGIAISKGATPIALGNKVHDGLGSGVFVIDHGGGVLEENDIFGNAKAGVEIKSGADPVVRKNKVHDGNGSGIYIADRGRGTIEDNDIYGNVYAGIDIYVGSDPVIRMNRINRNGSGIYVAYGNGKIKDNDLRDNRNGAISTIGNCFIEKSNNVEN